MTAQTEYHSATTATFKPVDYTTALKLIEFANRRNIGKSIEIAGKTYTLDHFSLRPSAFFKSRSCSIYYRVGRSVVRISDHWSTSRGFPRSRKFNCGYIGDSKWAIANHDDADIHAHAVGSGKYPYRFLAGICGLTGFKKIATS